jgi:hypothetical protein
VSIAAEIRGIFNLIDFVRFEDKSASDGLMEDLEGTINTSSKVRASFKYFIE